MTSATFDLYGAEGGGIIGGAGGRVTATLAVTPGASYQVRVGGWGGGTLLVDYNGGGNGYLDGGGASDVRGGAFGLADRLLVAGGGGSATNPIGVGGGAGGYLSGGSGGGSTSQIEETVTAGNSSLHYDPGTQRYSYVWKTDKA